MYKYVLNYWGPISPLWWSSRGLDIETDLFAGGAIFIMNMDENTDDIAGTYDIPIMSGRDWSRFNTWINNVHTEKIVPLEELIAAFEAESEKQIDWFLENDKQVYVQITEPMSLEEARNV